MLLLQSVLDGAMQHIVRNNALFRAINLLAFAVGPKTSMVPCLPRPLVKTSCVFDP
jgi:hypothetical protein